LFLLGNFWLFTLLFDESFLSTPNPFPLNGKKSQTNYLATIAFLAASFVIAAAIDIAPLITISKMLFFIFPPFMIP